MSTNSREPQLAHPSLLEGAASVEIYLGLTLRTQTISAYDTTLTGTQNVNLTKPSLPSGSDPAGLLRDLDRSRTASSVSASGNRRHSVGGVLVSTAIFGSLGLHPIPASVEGRYIAVEISAPALGHFYVPAWEQIFWRGPIRRR